MGFGNPYGDHWNLEILSKMDRILIEKELKFSL
jgi:hypothetical protein